MAPTNNLVSALLTDLYQLTMTYAHWKCGKHEEPGVFELFFRKNPFGGEFTIFCGLDECLKYLESFQFTAEDIDYLKSTPSLSHAKPGFFDYLATLNTQQLTVRAMQEGSVAFPRVPLLIIEAPLGLGQLLETALLNLVNYPSLIATNAARMVLRAAPAPCIEFGLRRAQGPDGAMSASKYSFVGGFVATSNVQAGATFHIPIAGTHAHAYVQAFSSLEEVKEETLLHKATNTQDLFLPAVLKYREKLDKGQTTNDGELAAFCAYACGFPDNFLCLVDTYDTLHSGLLNFVAVALALCDFGYAPKGIRLDSGDLRYLSLECQKYFLNIANQYERSEFQSLTIVASNDINEDILMDLRKEPHGITTYGIGTNLVTCQKQPALGCVYKLVEWKGQPRIKISQDLPKVTLPGRKRVYRLIGESGKALLDVVTLASETSPDVGTGFICRDPFSTHRILAHPSKVEEIHEVVFQNGTILNMPSVEEARSRVQAQLQILPPGVTDHAIACRFPVMVSQGLYTFLYNVWDAEAPLKELR